MYFILVRKTLFLFKKVKNSRLFLVKMMCAGHCYKLNKKKVVPQIKFKSKFLEKREYSCWEQVKSSMYPEKIKHTL